MQPLYQSPVCVNRERLCCKLAAEVCSHQIEPGLPVQGVSVLLLVSLGQFDLSGARTRLQGATVLLLVLQCQLDLMEAWLRSL